MAQQLSQLLKLIIRFLPQRKLELKPAGLSGEVEARGGGCSANGADATTPEACNGAVSIPQALRASRLSKALAPDISRLP
jgi:hypothetical protein